MANIGDASRKSFVSLNSLYPGVFVRHGDEAWCSDCGKSGVISLAGKNLIRNATGHIQSVKHGLNAVKVGGSSSKKITSFFAKVPRVEHTQNNKLQV